MECPKCHAQNADDAVCCSLCFENFKAKPKTIQHRGVGFEAVTSQFEGWLVTGPLMIAEDGFYFFVKDCISQTRMAMRVASSQFGLMGALAGAAVESQLDDSERPPKVTFQRSADIAERFQCVLGDAPEIPSCKEYFCVPKQDVQNLKFSFMSGLSLKTQNLSLTVNGLDEDKATGFLVMRGYPLER